MIQMTASLTTYNMDAYIRNLDKLKVIVGKAAADIEGQAKASILTSSGRYKVYNRIRTKKRKGKTTRKKVEHWSSPPGTPPNTDTGNLANSIKNRRAGSPTSRDIVVHAKYGVPLELGWISKGGNHVPPRPFLRPAFDRVAPGFLLAVRSVMRGR